MSILSNISIPNTCFYCSSKRLINWPALPLAVPSSHWSHWSSSRTSTAVGKLSNKRLPVTLRTRLAPNWPLDTSTEILVRVHHHLIVVFQSFNFNIIIPNPLYLSTHHLLSLGFDPLGLANNLDADAFALVQTKELNNGRLAMIGAAGRNNNPTSLHKRLIENPPKTTHNLSNDRPCIILTLSHRYKTYIPPPPPPQYHTNQTSGMIAQELINGKGVLENLGLEAALPKAFDTATF